MTKFEELSDYFLQNNFWKRNSGEYSNEVTAFLYNLKESKIVDKTLKTEHIMYPKNLWIENEKLTLYFFCTNSITICNYDDDKIFLTKKYVKDIIQLDLKNVNNEFKSIDLGIIFSDGYVISLSSNNTNKEWKNKFFIKINGIYELYSEPTFK